MICHVAPCDAPSVDSGRDLATLTDVDVIAAMRQPVTLAAAYANLRAALCIDTPPSIRRALEPLHPS